MKGENTPLHYTDTKPVGAADFYFAINATFRFILRKRGMVGLQRYWTDLGRTYFAPVSKRWSEGGLPAVASYWRAFFAAEPAAEVEVLEEANSVTLQVKVCPAIRHLREHGREIVPSFCQHCWHVGEAMAAPAGLTVRIQGGNGCCRQTFARVESFLPPQDSKHIVEVTC